MCQRRLLYLQFLAVIYFFLYSLPLSRVGKEEGVDTVPFRRAAWFYIQSIKGIRRDDYNYKEVNRVLNISFKTYIRMVRRGQGR